MAYDESLAERIRAILKGTKGISEKKMFGGLSFLVNGNMCCGIINEKLVLRLGEKAAADAMQEPHTSAMDFTGRPMKSMIYVDAAGTKRDADLKAWVDRSLVVAKGLSPKG